MTGRDDTRTLGYQPALDGLRGVSVLLVLLFHGGFAAFSGGYVGVSVFFTLSGYLITALLLEERSRSGAIRIGRFYARRAKRLLPASLLCLIGITVLARIGTIEPTSSLRRDLVASLLQVKNWTSIVSGRSYTELLDLAQGRPSPLEHYWSLAIEEQFYVVWPLVVLLLTKLLRPRGVARSIVALAVVAAIAAPIIAAHWGVDVAYWSSPTRFGEILTGAALAAALRLREAPVRERVGWLFVPSMAVIVWAATQWSSGSGPAYRGMMPVFSLASVGVILALQAEGRPRRALSWRPAVALGTISYGVYLFHWPVFVVLDGERTDLARLPLFAVRLAVTIAIAIASYVLLERPVRRANWNGGRVAAAAFTGMAIGALAIVVVAPTPLDRLAVAIDDLPDLPPPPAPTGSFVPLLPATTSTTATSTTSTTATTPDTAPDTVPVITTTTLDLTYPPPVRPVRIVVAGDSTAWLTAVALDDWAKAHPDQAQVSLIAAAGCGFIAGGRPVAEFSEQIEADCNDLRTRRLPAEVARFQPDVVVLMVSFRDIDDRVWDDAEGPLTPFDGRFRNRMLQDYRRLTQQLLDAGVPRVAWVNPPITEAHWVGDAAVRLDPNRYVVYGRELDSVADGRSNVRVIDLAHWFASSPLSSTDGTRPDGIHWSAAAGDEVVAEFFAPAVMAAALR